MGRPQQVSDDEINDAARTCFLESGPHVPVKAVADRLGISTAALFGRVATKEQLLLRAFFSGSPGPGRALALMDAGPRASTTTALRDELLAILVELCSVVRQVVPGLVMMRAAGIPWRRIVSLSTSSSLAPDPPTALRQTLVVFLRRARARGLWRRVQPRPMAEALLGPLEARAFHAHVLGDDHTAEDDAVFCRELLVGLMQAPVRRRTIPSRRRTP